MKTNAKAAILLDAENLTHWIKYDGPKTLLNELNADGSFIIRKAYARWTNESLADFQESLTLLGFDLIHTFHPVSKKNSADIQLTVDAMQFAAVKTVQTFVLATGDSDFSPLFRRLREMGKTVIGVGKRSPLSESVRNSCSRFIYTNAAGKPERNNNPPKAQPPRKSIALLNRALDRFTTPVDCSRLKKMMLELDDSFDHKQYGYAQFIKFLRAAPTVVVSRQGTNWSVAPKSDKPQTPAKTPAKT